MINQLITKFFCYLCLKLFNIFINKFNNFTAIYIN